MKRNFNIINKFLSTYDNNGIVISWYWNIHETDEPTWNYYEIKTYSGKKANIPENIVELITKMIQKYWHETFEGTISELGTNRLNLLIKPKKMEWVLTGEIEEELETDDSDSGKVKSEEFNQYMENNNVKFIGADYNGGGDDGYINTIEIDGEEKTQQQLERNSKTEIVVNTLYDLLENGFSGWEIDSGSYGSLEIIKEVGKDAIYIINHKWLRFDFVDTENTVIITENTFKNEE